MNEMLTIIRRAFRTVEKEYVGVELPIAEGEVPRAIRGVLWRNGPGRLERGGVDYGHPFDGDGLVTRFEFLEGRVRYSNRFVRTRELVREQETDRLCFRAFGTNRPGGLLRNALRMRFKNAANTNVVPHGGRLLALWEAGWPHRLDPDDLTTLERFSFGGRLVNRRTIIDRMVSPELPFSAHPRVDEQTGDLVNFGLAYGVKNRLMLYRVAPDGSMDAPQSITLDALSFAHDFVLTPNWCVFVLPAVRFEVVLALLGLRTPVGSLRLEPDRPMQALLVPRAGGTPKRIETVPGFVFHFANGFEDEDGHVVLDGMKTVGFPDLTDLDPLFSEPGNTEIMARPTRFVLDPQRGTCHTTRLSEHAAELPRVAPGCFGRDHGVFWTTSAPPDRNQPFLSGIARFDTSNRETLMREFYPDLPGEPIPIPDDSSDPGAARWLLTLLYVAEEHVTDLLVLDAETLGTVARLRLPHHLPPGFHGNFVSAEALGAVAGAADLA